MGQFWNWFVDIFKLILLFFHTYTHSWGWSIVLLTVLIKMILFPTTIKQFQAMHKMKEVQPKLKEIQDKYKDKPEEMQKRLLEIYRTEKVNPFGSCLPMIIQIPLLIAIYNLLSIPHFMKDTTIQSSSFFWLQLGQSHNIILAVISGATTYLQQRLTTPLTGGDQSQQQVFLYFMPLMFGFITWQVNAGVGLYWVISNLVGIGQQYLINEYFIVKEHILPAPAADTKKK